jgi:hypothetical protein
MIFGLEQRRKRIESRLTAPAKCRGFVPGERPLLGKAKVSSWPAFPLRRNAVRADVFGASVSRFFTAAVADR